MVIRCSRPPSSCTTIIVKSIYDEPVGRTLVELIARRSYVVDSAIEWRLYSTTLAALSSPLMNVEHVHQITYGILKNLVSLLVRNKPETLRLVYVFHTSTVIVTENRLPKLSSEMFPYRESLLLLGYCAVYSGNSRLII